MTEHIFPRTDIAPQRATGELLSRLYREIGISAVAAALQMSDSQLLKSHSDAATMPAMSDRHDRAART